MHRQPDRGRGALHGSVWQRKHVVNVTVEADALCGPLLARRAAEAGVIYSLAYGDQPALICDLVDWARAAGFSVVAAGRGHKWLPHFAQSTPDTVWGYYGLTPGAGAIAAASTRRCSIPFSTAPNRRSRAAAVCNATGLAAPPDGLDLPAGGDRRHPDACAARSPRAACCTQKGQVEVISSLQRDGREIGYDIRFGVFVVFEGETEYVRNCFKEYMVRTDPSGRYACLYKRWHLIGLEVGISVASVGLRGEATGTAIGFHADVVATAKRDLKAGELSTAKAATPSGASSCRRGNRSNSAACRSALPAARSWCEP